MSGHKSNQITCKQSVLKICFEKQMGFACSLTKTKTEVECSQELILVSSLLWLSTLAPRGERERREARRRTSDSFQETHIRTQRFLIKCSASDFWKASVIKNSIPKPQFTQSWKAEWGGKKPVKYLGGALLISTYFILRWLRRQKAAITLPLAVCQRNTTPRL